MPRVCFADDLLRETEPAIDRLGMPIVTSGQFAYVFKLNLPTGAGSFAVRAFRSFQADRERRYEMIEAHLRAHPIPALGNFDYDAQGLNVDGRFYPVLVMPWIEGHTLDVYLDEVLRRESSGEVLRHLANEWLRLMQSLREANVAHGDLQHGNIIVESGRLRLVDLDGMFVPAMRGMRASEIGHQHYQHPRRTPAFFDDNLDHFSALVIYLSLLALAEKPALWARYHDENLLFTKRDFLAPETSALFAEVRAINDECAHFAEMLATSARGDAASVPNVLEAIATPAKSKLPGWMIAPVDIEVRPRTREATHINIPAQVAVREQATTRVLTVAGMRQMPSTPASQNVQSIFSGNAQMPTVSDPYTTPLDPSKFWEAAFYYMRRGRYVKKSTWADYLGMQVIIQGSFHLLNGLGVNLWICLFVVAFLTAMAVFIRGFVIAYKKLATDKKNFATLFSPARLSSLQISNNLAPRMTRIAPVANTHIVGSRTQGIYHRAACEWANRIATRNRVPFTSASAASDAGYRQCKVCQP